MANKYGLTPLNITADSSYLKVVRLLLDQGVDLTAVNNQGMMPLYTATYRGYVEILRLLLDHKTCLALQTKMVFAKPGVNVDHGLYNNQISSLVGRQ